MSPIFTYHAKDKNGKYQDGKIDALNKNDAIDTLEAQGLYVVSIKEGINIITKGEEKSELSNKKPLLVLGGIIVFVIAIITFWNTNIFRNNTIKKVAEETNEKEYRLVEEETIDLKELNFILRKEYKIIVPRRISIQKLDAVIEDLINNKIKENKDIDEIVILIYDKEKDVQGKYTVAKAIWGVGGKLDDSTAQLANTNDKSRHDISFDIVGASLIKSKSYY